MGGANVDASTVTVLIAMLVLTVVFMALWSIFTSDDETRYYQEIGAKGGKSKKVVEEEEVDPEEEELV